MAGVAGDVLWRGGRTPGGRPLNRVLTRRGALAVAHAMLAARTRYLRRT